MRRAYRTYQEWAEDHDWEAEHSLDAADIYPGHDVSTHRQGCRLPHENKHDQRTNPPGEILRVAIQRREAQGCQH